MCGSWDHQCRARNLTDRACNLTDLLSAPTSILNTLACKALVQWEQPHLREQRCQARSMRALGRAEVLGVGQRRSKRGALRLHHVHLHGTTTLSANSSSYGSSAGRVG